MDNSFEGSEVRLELEYYTDPLCAWSWGFEPQWRRLRYEFAAQLRWRYRMGGMLSDWQRYNDPLNDISRPVQMGPLWHQIAEVSGMPLDDRCGSRTRQPRPTPPASPSRRRSCSHRRRESTTCAVCARRSCGSGATSPAVTFSWPSLTN